MYPTSVRGFGLSLCSSFSRVGAMISPYIAQVCGPCLNCYESFKSQLCNYYHRNIFSLTYLQTLLSYTTTGTFVVFIVFSAISLIAALLLPIETRGRAMKVNVKLHAKPLYSYTFYLLYLCNRTLVDDSMNSCESIELFCIIYFFILILYSY